MHKYVFNGSEPKSNYNKIPRYPINKVANDLELQDNADVVESAICQFDEELNLTINDNIALRLTELLLDRYYFNDKEIKFKTKLEENGYDVVSEMPKAVSLGATKSISSGYDISIKTV